MSPGQERPMLVMTTQRTLHPRYPVCQPVAARRIPSAPRRRAKRRRRSRRGPLTLWVLALLLFAALAWFKTVSFGASDCPPQDSVFSSSLPALSNLSSPRSALLDRTSGELIAEQNTDTEAPPASLTKMMTVLLAIENLPDLDQTVTVPAEIFNDLWTENASLAGFAPGESVPLRDLLYGAILPSGAECCLTLARQVSGSEDAFVEQMNLRAQELGLEHTHFTNCTGLEAPDHYASAADLAHLLDTALENETFRQVFTSRSHTTSATGEHPQGFTMYSSMFARLDALPGQGGELLGGKTGYTSQAGLCLASLMEVEGREYILVTTGAPGDHSTEPYHLLDALEVCRQLRDGALSA